MAMSCSTQSYWVSVDGCLRSVLLMPPAWCEFEFNLWVIRQTSETLGPESFSSYCTSSTKFSHSDTQWCIKLCPLICIIKAVRQAPTLHDELRLIQTLSENVASVSHCRGAQEWTADSHTAEIIKNLRGRRDSSGRRTAKQNIADFHSHIGVTTLQETLK